MSRMQGPRSPCHLLNLGLGSLNPNLNRDGYDHALVVTALTSLAVTILVVIIVMVWLLWFRVQGLG